MQNIKKIFWTKGPCSHAIFYLLNQEFGFQKEFEEQASDPLAGGIYQQGYQCGMLWGASLSTGAEAYRRFKNINHAIEASIIATQCVIKSFINKAKSMDCYDITKCDTTTKFGLIKLFITGKPISCTNLSSKWAPIAFQSANESLSAYKPVNLNAEVFSCASEVIKKMNGSEEEMIMVSGFAGGLGLSGNACGALAGAIWMNTLSRIKNNNYKSPMTDPVIANILDIFYTETNFEMECSKICNRKFSNIEEHSEYIKNGGCGKLIDLLAIIK